MLYSASQHAPFASHAPPTPPLQATGRRSCRSSCWRPPACTASTSIRPCTSRPRAWRSWATARGPHMTAWPTGSWLRALVGRRLPLAAGCRPQAGCCRPSCCPEAAAALAATARRLQPAACVWRGLVQPLHFTLSLQVCLQQFASAFGRSASLGQLLSRCVVSGPIFLAHLPRPAPPFCPWRRRLYHPFLPVCKLAFQQLSRGVSPPQAMRGLLWRRPARHFAPRC